MAANWYWAKVARHAGEFWVTIPDLPGVNVADPDEKRALEIAAEFAADYLADLVNDGHAIPKASDMPPIENDDEAARALIPVDVPGRSVKISLSIDEALLARADQAAQRAGETRSGFFAAAVQQRIRVAASDEVTVERIERALRGVDLVKLVTAEIRK